MLDGSEEQLITEAFCVPIETDGAESSFASIAPRLTSDVNEDTDTEVPQDGEISKDFAGIIGGLTAFCGP